MSASPPASTGLYDPSHEHDACGVGFVVDIKGRQSHAIVEQALQVLINLLHRGACGCEANTGDGAGILIQMPDRFLRKVTRRSASRCRRPASTAPASSSCRRSTPSASNCRAADRADRRRRRPAPARLARRADRRLEPWARRARADQAGLRAGVHRATAGAPRPRTTARRGSAFERELYVIRKRIEHAVDGWPLAERQRLLHRQPVVRTR